MSDGAAQNGATQAASTGEAAPAAAAAVAATAPSAVPAAPQMATPAAASAAPLPAGAVAVPAAPVAAAAAQAAAAPAADCVPAKKKPVAAHNKKDGEEEHARALADDEDQNLSQPAEGCVLPQTGAPAPAAEAAPAETAAVADDGGEGGINPGLLIGAGVLAAVGVGVLALSGGDDDDDDNVVVPPPPPANGAPVAVADTGAVNEGASLTGSVATNDTDPNGDPLTFAVTGAVPAGLTLNANGSYTFDANNAAYNSLAAGATQAVVANYSVSDGRGGTASSTLTITVTGTNDAPVAVADTGPAATEGGAAVTGSVATNDTDPDTGAALTFALVNPVAGLTLNANGTYSFNPADPAYNSLAAGATQNVVANYRVTDGQGASSTSTLTIVVTGTNDGPVAANDTATATEDGAVVTGNLAANDSDPDTGVAAATYALAAPVAGLTVNANGTFSFNPADPAYNALNAGQTQNVVANVVVTDASGATATSTLTITVTGVTDAPATTNLDIDNDANLNTRRAFDASAGTVGFTDAAAAANTVVINGFGDDDFITFDSPFSGATAVSFANFDFDGSGGANDLRITTNRGGEVSDIIITNVVAANALITDEASADAAVAGTDNFRTSAVTTRTTVSLDQDSDSNPLTSFTITPAANTGSFDYTENADTANTVRVNDFGGDDTITFNVGVNDVSFGSGDFDADGSADDLRITINRSGTISDIVLVNAVAANSLVFDEASAEAAIGAGFDNFRFSGSSATGADAISIVAPGNQVFGSGDHFQFA